MSEIEAIGFDDVSAIDFLVAFQGKLRDHEVALLGEEKVTVFMRGDKDGAPTHGFLKGDGLEGFPHSFPGESLHAAELSVAASSEEMTVMQHGCVHDAVKVGRLRLAGALRAIDDRRGGFIFLKFKEHRSVVEAGEKEMISVNHLRSYDGEAVTNFPGNAPVDFARQRIERIDSLRMPDEEEIAAAMLDDARRAIAGMFG